MQLLTSILTAGGDPRIGYDSTIASFGSCFAVNIADKFAHFQFRATCNPFGILFHPMAIERLFSYAVSQRQFVAPDVFYHNERWHHFDAHSDLSAASQDDLLGRLNASVLGTREALLLATHIIITYGTAWTYRERETQRLVANCHKVPQNAFEKELLPVAAIAESVENTMALIRTLNASAPIIFTISPVRHIKDGFVGNQRSKSHLIAALHGVLGSSANCAYFPAYEIMMDELRDYRFYAADMIHPSALAIDYIWEKFAHSWIDGSARVVMQRVDHIRKRLAHRPFNAQAEAHRKFASALASDIASVQSEFPHMVF